MSNPFALNALNGYSSSVSAVSNPYIGGGSSSQVGAGSIFGAQGAQTGGQPKVGGANHQSQLNEVSQIGMEKKEGYMNGLGGTNNPDDHKLFLYA